MDGLLLAGLAFKLYHHDSDVVRATTVEGLEDDALGAEVRLVQSFPDEADRLLVAEGVPQAVGRQDHELRLHLVQVEGHDVRIGHDHVEVLQGVVAQRTGHGQDALDAPWTVETDETTWGGSRRKKWLEDDQTSSGKWRKKKWSEKKEKHKREKRRNRCSLCYCCYNTRFYFSSYEPAAMFPHLHHVHIKVRIIIWILATDMFSLSLNAHGTNYLCWIHFNSCHILRVQLCVLSGSGWLVSRDHSAGNDWSRWRLPY